MKRMLSALAVLLLAAPVWADVTVIGTGAVQATPDMSVIRMAVVTTAETVVPALEDNGKAVRKLKATLTALNIEEKDVCTTGFNIQPRYNHPKDEQPKLIGYVVEHDITVRVRKLSDAGKVLDAVVKDGANRIDGVGFTFSDPEALLDKARVAAVEDAHRKAEMMVKTAGGKVGFLKSISEQRSYNAYADSGMARAVNAPAGQPVGPGERTLTVQVIVVWNIDNPLGRKPGITPEK